VTEQLLHASGTIADGADLHAEGEVVRLAASHCETCDRWEFPARDYCPNGDGEPVPGALSSQGRIQGFTAVMHAPPGGLLETPYVVALVEFPEGISVMSAMPGFGLHEVAIGDRVETVSHLVGESLEYVVRPSTAT
jgi:uncharacterized OB-fold protein